MYTWLLMTKPKKRKVSFEEYQKVAKDLSDKYGKGSINVETGEFTPIE